MTESTTEATETNTASESQQQDSPAWDDLFKGEDPAKVKEALEQSRKWEARAKENHKAKTELEQQRRAEMSDAERALTEAEERGRTTATETFGKRLATSEIRAAAADSGRDLTGVFDYLDLTRFVGDDGEPDEKAIKTFVDGLPVIDDGKPRAPKPDANQGRSGAGGPKSTADSFAEFFRNNLSER